MVGSINTNIANGLLRAVATNSNMNWLANQTLTNQMTFNVGNITYSYNIWSRLFIKLELKRNE